MQKIVPQDKPTSGIVNSLRTLVRLRLVGYTSGPQPFENLEDHLQILSLGCGPPWKLCHGKLPKLIWFCVYILAK